MIVVVGDIVLGYISYIRINGYLNKLHNQINFIGF